MALTEGVLADDCLFAFGEADFSRVYGERRAPAR
jgi:hypothetical protein